MRILFAVLLFLPAFAVADDSPLFSSDTPLDLLFEFPVRTIVRKAESRPVVEGSVSYADESGQPTRIELTMTTRGKSRLELCQFPPLSADFKKQQRKGTLFAGQKKLKIATLCKNNDTYLRYLLQEYGIYRAFNALTEKSFRVRMINATYRDLEGKQKDLTASAFFIESDDEVADRLGMQTQDVSIINPPQLDPEHASLSALFQYLVANTDWSSLRGPGEEGCCHNGKVLVRPGSASGWLVIPYDFDQSGIINTKYSMPADGLGIRSVRQRIYRGRCLHLDKLDSVIALFNARRANIEAALLPAELQGKFRNATVEYIDEFYRIINDPAQRMEQIESRCVGN
jgi:hypothetical protein